MRSCRNRCYCFLVTFSLLFAVSQSALAQNDPTTALVGSWNGWFETIERGANPVRNLTILSVVPKDGGGWIAKANFWGSPYDIEVSREGEDIFLDWVYGKDRIPIRVKLIGTNKLEGQHHPWSARSGGAKTNLSAKFEKK